MHSQLGDTEWNSKISLSCKIYEFSSKISVINLRPLCPLALPFKVKRHHWSPLVTAAPSILLCSTLETPVLSKPCYINKVDWIGSDYGATNSIVTLFINSLHDGLRNGLCSESAGVFFFFGVRGSSE